MSFETKTLKGENEMLSVKLKEYQERYAHIFLQLKKFITKTWTLKLLSTFLNNFNCLTSHLVDNVKLKFPVAQFQCGHTS